MVGTRDAPEVRAVDHHGWTPVLQALRADALDCMQTTFALITDHAHGAGTHLALGARWSLRSPASTQEARAAEARELLGLRLTARWQEVDGPGLCQAAELHRCLYVTADAYHMPWLPYAGRQHMAHSFLLGADPDGLVVVDAYHNDTQWGPARPGAWRVTSGQLDTAATAGATAMVLAADPPPRLDVPSMLARNAERMGTDLVDRRVARARDMIDDCEGMERLVLDIWLTGRERLLHAAWLATLAEPPAAAPDMMRQADGWRQLAAQSYVSLRRARRGRPVDLGVVHGLARLLRSDLELARRLGQQDDVGEDGAVTVRAAVVAALGTVLGLDAHTINASRALRELPGFDSYRLVEVIERTEQMLGVEAAVNRVGADGLRDLNGLCRMFTAAEGPR